MFMDEIIFKNLLENNPEGASKDKTVNLAMSSLLKLDDDGKMRTYYTSLPIFISV